jgi:hypothetical protein
MAQQEASVRWGLILTLAPSRSQGEPGGDRFLVEATLSPGEYSVRLVARAPDLEVTRRAPTPSVLPLPFPLACR